MANKLIGKTIINVKIARDKKAILFVAADGHDVKAYCDADCCSYTWIEHIELPSLPFVVTNIEDISMPDLGGGDYYEVIIYYGCKITTDKGIMLIDYRNSSNGYYGGNLCWEGDYLYGGVYGQNISKEDWIDVTV